MAYDLQNLGFIPPDVGDEVLQEMAGPLGRILSQLSGGGGATKLNIDAGEQPALGCGHSGLLLSVTPVLATDDGSVVPIHIDTRTHTRTTCKLTLCASPSHTNTHGATSQ